MGIKYDHLDIVERTKIAIFHKFEFPLGDIAWMVGRSKSTVSRELSRNSIGKVYEPNLAEGLYDSRRHRGESQGKFTEFTKAHIKDKLDEGYSPEQISFSLSKNSIASVSHEAIYQYIAEDRASGGVLYLDLPRKGKKYKKRAKRPKKKFKESAAIKTLISERPDKKVLEVELGHWEGDTVESKGHKGGINTMVEIGSKLCIFRKVLDKTAESTKDAIISVFSECNELFQSLTLDNGSEFAMHSLMSEKLKGKVYFCHANSPWERGLNENTNGLLRRFYPKGTDFNNISVKELKHVQDKLNNRPRKTLGYRTPAEVFAEKLEKNGMNNKLIERL